MIQSYILTPHAVTKIWKSHGADLTHWPHARWRLDEGHFTRGQWKFQSSQHGNSTAGLVSEEMTLLDLGVSNLEDAIHGYVVVSKDHPRFKGP